MRLFFSVGEPSGDQHAACLIEELRNRVPTLDAVGFGGPLMEGVGFRSHYRLTDLAVMGILRVLPLILKFRRLILEAGRLLETERPDAVVLVDFPGFNWWIARKAKQLGIPVVYYLPPQLWAWAPWRIRRVRKWVDKVLCPLEFEQRWYADRGIPAELVGHPFFDEVREHKLDREFVARCQEKGEHLVGILPGSRNQEVTQNWPIMVAQMRRIHAAHRNVHFQVACFSSAHRDQCQDVLRSAGEPLPVEFSVGKTPEIIAAADCCLMVSGSVSLEMLARQTPAVVVYHLGGFGRLLAKVFVTCPFISLPNLMEGQEIFPEFFPSRPEDHAANQAADRVSAWLSDHGQLEQVRERLQALHGRAGETGAIGRAADAILESVTSLANRAA